MAKSKSPKSKDDEQQTYEEELRDHNELGEVFRKMGAVKGSPHSLPKLNPDGSMQDDLHGLEQHDGGDTDSE